MFTIEVGKEEKDKNFSFRVLKMFHQECYGGEITMLECGSSGTGGRGAWLLICQRCGASRIVLAQEHTVIIIATAVDGQERKFEIFTDGFREEDKGRGGNVTVIQRITKD